ncbi:hypothetical protein [Aquimarina spongiae]|uniref:Uncharacterized protein n=1 Tax=Aquimarina spongiae TaxID=570521 RepID=A0A1M6JMG7_9FLAO|nr:hypothetical protein [Aquimarina spongiae]SHJ47813.1 hypothetical protein SAMN04488508_109142 [Aquimarina spongiae]
MKTLDDFKPILPLTFQKVERTPYDVKRNAHFISVKAIGTTAMQPYNFYRPISKMVSI